MISLGKALKTADLVEKQRLELTQLYLSAIEVCAKNAVELPAHDGSESSLKLKGLLSDLLRDSSLAALTTSLAQFEAFMAEYRGAVAQAVASNAQEIKLVLDLLSETTNALKAADERAGSELGTFITHLQETAETNDPTRLRLLLTLQVRHMKNWLVKFQAESSSRMAPVEQQLQSFQLRLREVEQLASSDPLTNLLNRREGERQGALRVDQQTTFCVMVVDLNSFKRMNDQYGHQAGDAVLKFVASCLKQTVRATDAVCRWGGDEFAVIIDCDLKNAEARAADIHRRFGAPFEFSLEGRTTSIPVQVSIGIVEHIKGESFDDTFHRADLEMYRHKKANLSESEKASVYALTHSSTDSTPPGSYVK